MDLNKIHSLLRFYQKEKSKIKFKLKSRPTIEISGTIKYLSYLLFSKDYAYVVIQEDDKDSIKTFLNDIDPLTIFPVHVDQKPFFVKVDRINIPQGLRFEILNKYNHTCQYCGRTSPEVELEIDHVKPLAQGGTNNVDNLTVSCRDCNRGKFTKDLFS